MRDELAVGRDDHRIAVLADPDTVDHPPHLFETRFRDQPAGGLIQARKVNGEDRGGQQIGVDTNRGHLHAADRERRILGNLQSCRADAARRARVEPVVHSRENRRVRLLFLVLPGHVIGAREYVAWHPVQPHRFERQCRLPECRARANPNQQTRRFHEPAV